MNAMDDIKEKLQGNESIEAIVFGKWGWNGHYKPDGIQDPPIGKILSESEAKPYCENWSFGGDYGAPECFAVYIWTTQRVGWVSEYDGATCLRWVARNPVSCTPRMS